MFGVCFRLVASRVQECTRKGSARSWDHCQVVHEIWTQALMGKTRLWIERVPTDDNLADLPSREEYALLEEMHAQWREPVVAQLFLDGVQLFGAQ